jgi:hypothetical protein
VFSRSPFSKELLENTFRRFLEAPKGYFIKILQIKFVFLNYSKNKTNKESYLFAAK